MLLWRVMCPEEHARAVLHCERSMPEPSFTVLYPEELARAVLHYDVAFLDRCQGLPSLCRGAAECDATITMLVWHPMARAAHCLEGSAGGLLSPHEGRDCLRAVGEHSWQAQAQQQEACQRCARCMQEAGCLPFPRLFSCAENSGSMFARNSGSSFRQINDCHCFRHMTATGSDR